MKNTFKVILIILLTSVVNVGAYYAFKAIDFKRRFGRFKNSFTEYWGQVAKEAYVNGMLGYLTPKNYNKAMTEQKAIVDLIIKKMQADGNAPANLVTNEQKMTFITDNPQYLEYAKNDINFLVNQPNFDPFKFDNINNEIVRKLSESGIDVYNLDTLDKAKILIREYFKN